MKKEMKKKMRFVFAVLAVAALVLTFADGAPALAAANVIIHNTFDDKISVALCYFNNTSKKWTVEGWWSVEGNESETVTLKSADAAQKVYYLAERGHLNYVDESTLDRERINRYVSDAMFEYDFTGKPKNAKNPRIAPFYSIRYNAGSKAFVVRLDTQPKG